MQITLNKDANVKSGATLIEGFPGFGLVGTIATEFLIEHLNTRIIGTFDAKELPATTAIHNGKVVQPMAIHYAEAENLIILHTILSVKGFEWQTATEVERVAKELKVKEIISLEGVNAMLPSQETQVYTYGNEKFEKLGAKAMQESIIMGVTAILLLRCKMTSCLFAETHSGLPDSKAAAAILNILDSYLQLKLDTKPLLKQAEKFEDKLKTIMQQTQQSMDEVDKKKLSYLG